MKKLQQLLLAGGVLLAAPFASADMIFGVHAGADYWAADADGRLGSDPNDLGNFNMDSDSQVSLWVSVEHPIPFVPNLGIRQTGLDFSGRGDFNFNFFGNDYNGVIGTDVDMQHTDLVLYYEFLDNGLISFDAGVNLRYLDATITVEDDQGIIGATRRDASGVVPMLYVAAEAGILFTGLSIYGDASVLSIDGHSLTDYQAGIAYEFIDNIAIDVSARIGYRSMKLELDDLDGIYSDVDLSGVTAGLRVHF